MESALPEPQPTGWRAALARRVKRRMKRRIVILAIYIVILQLPPVAEARRDMTGQVGPTVEALARDLRTLTLMARAERERRESAALLTEEPPQPCVAPRRETRGQGGSIQFQRPGHC